jgi:hypothetical protein
MISEKIFYTENFFCPLCKDINTQCTLFHDYHTSQHLFDCWSFFHIIGGILLGFFTKKIEYVVIIGIFFEIYENSYLGVKMWKNLNFTKRDSFDTYINIIGDMACVIAGFYITKLGFNSSFHFVLSLLFIILLFMIFLKNCSVTKQLESVLLNWK